MNGVREEARWLAVPIGFAVLLALSLIVRWLPAGVERAQDAYGFWQVIGGNILLLWQALQRGLVAFVVTVPALALLPPIRWRDVGYISIAAVVAEIAAELATAAIAGVHAARTLQLLMTGLAYLAVLMCASLWIRRHHGAV